MLNIIEDNRNDKKYINNGMRMTSDSRFKN